MSDTKTAAKPAEAAKPAADQAPRMPDTAREPVMLRENQIKTAEAGFQTWHALADHEHSIEDVLHPSYLWRKAAQLRKHHRVIIDHAGGQFSVTLYIHGVDSELGCVIFDIDDIKRDRTRQQRPGIDLSGARIELRGALKYAVILGGKPLKSGFDTEDEAAAWLRKKERGIAR